MEQVKKPDFVATFDDSDSDSEIELSKPESFHNTSWKPQQKVPLAQPTVPLAQPTVPLAQETNKANHNELPKEVPKENIMETSKTQLAETIEIPNPSSIFPHIMACSNLPSKFHHFRFRHASDLNRMTQLLRQVDSNMEVIHNETNKDNVDITLQTRGEIVGKIQFLHFDRRDKDNKSKYYVKLYFYQFKSTSMFQQVMQVVKSFFISLGASKRHSMKSTKHHRKTKHHKRRPVRRHTHRRPRHA